MNAVLQSALVMLLGTLLAPAPTETTEPTEASTAAAPDAGSVFLRPSSDPSRLFLPSRAKAPMTLGPFMARMQDRVADLLPANDAGDFLPAKPNSDATSDALMRPR